MLWPWFCRSKPAFGLTTSLPPKLLCPNTTTTTTAATATATKTTTNSSSSSNNNNNNNSSSNNYNIIDQLVSARNEKKKRERILDHHANKTKTVLLWTPLQSPPMGVWKSKLFRKTLEGKCPESRCNFTTDK